MADLSDLAHEVLACWDGRPKARLSLVYDIALPIATRTNRSALSAINELISAGLIDGQATLVRTREFWTVRFENLEQDAEVHFGTFPTAWTARLLKGSKQVTPPEARLVRRLDHTPEGEYGPEALRVLLDMPAPPKRPTGFITSEDR